MGKLDTYENVLLAIGVTFGITQIESILGITLICLQILVLFLKYVPKLLTKIQNIIKHLKSKNIEEIKSEINNIVDETEDLIEDIKNIK